MSGFDDALREVVRDAVRQEIAAFITEMRCGKSRQSEEFLSLRKCAKASHKAPGDVGSALATGALIGARSGSRWKVSSVNLAAWCAAGCPKSKL